MEKVSKAFWNVAPLRSQLQMILEINSALKKRGGIERRGELFSASARPRAQRTLHSAALLCSTFKTKFTFWTLNFSNGAAAFSSHFHPISNEHKGIEKCTLPYPGLFEKTIPVCRHTLVNSGYYVRRVRLPTEFISPLQMLLLPAGCFFRPASVNREGVCEAKTKGNAVDGLAN